MLWRAPRPRGVLKGIGQPDQRWLAEGPAHECDAYGQAEGKTRRHVDRRVACQGRWLRAPAFTGIAIYQVDEPGWAICRHHQGIQVVTIHHRVDTLLARKPVVLGQRLLVGYVLQRGRLL